MTVWLANPGKMDLTAVRAMGINVKENENPIGHFGTGMKYAIAILLRTGHKVKLLVGEETYEFTTRPVEVRGKQFEFVYMNDEQLAYTTELGKEWEVWQAYRELHSNCMDESGEVLDKPLKNDTVWVIQGEDFQECYYDRYSIFLNTRPIIANSELEIHEGESSYIFYRGVRVHRLPKKSRFTYNFLRGIVLTEDRTAKSSYDIAYKMASIFPSMTGAEFWNRFFDGSSKDRFEDSLEYEYCSNPSENFLEAAGNMYKEGKLTNSQTKLYRRFSQVKDIQKITISETEQKIIDEAIEMCRLTLNVDIEVSTLFFTEDLGAGIYGKYQDGKILIPRQTIANGREFLMITIWEEWIHQKLGLLDQTRAMQQYLFDKVLSFANEKWSKLKDK